MQKNSFCGPAALSSVMQYYGLQIDQETIARQVYTEKLKGALITDLENFAKRTNFMTRLSMGTTNDIKNYIRKKKPVIVLIDAGFWIVSFNHYLVVVGYDNYGFLAHTGFKKEKLIPYADFMDMWDKMGNTFLVIYKEK